MKTAYAYARFSSDRQREESIDAQLRAIREYCDREGITIVHVFVDRAQSGTTDKREEFQSMIKAAGKGDVDYIIVHKLDRFARNRFDSAFYRRELKKHGVRLLSVLERIDDTPEGIILEAMIEGWNEYYSANLAREVMKGLRETALQCKHTGGRPPLGYKVNPDHTYSIEPVGAEIVRTIFTAYADGKSYSEILRMLDGQRTGSGAPFGKNSISEILRNEKYTGTFIFNRSASKDVDGKRNNHRSKSDADIIRVPYGMPQIVDERLFDACAARLRDNQRNGAGSAKRIYLLSGRLYCGRCGAAMSGASTKAGRGKQLYTYYTCGAHTRTGACDMPRISANQIDAAVISAIAQVLAFTDDDIRRLYELLNASVPVESDYIKGLRQELSEVRRKAASLAQAITDDPIPLLVDQLRILDAREQVLATSIRASESSSLRPSLDDLTAFCRRELDVRNLPLEEQRALVFRIVDRVVFRSYDDFDLILRVPVSPSDGDGPGSSPGSCPSGTSDPCFAFGLIQSASTRKKTRRR